MGNRMDTGTPDPRNLLVVARRCHGSEYLSGYSIWRQRRDAACTPRAAAARCGTADISHEHGVICARGEVSRS
jgi:hypothetical protein